MKLVKIELTVWAGIPDHYTIETLDEAITVNITGGHVNDLEVADVDDVEDD